MIRPHGGPPGRRDCEGPPVNIDPPEDLIGLVPVEVGAAVGTARWFARAARELQDARGCMTRCSTSSSWPPIWRRPIWRW